ncbi:WD40 repeat domain-containing protein, partial [archaeon]
MLIKDVDNSDASRVRTEFIKIDFRLVNPLTSAIVVFLDGGPRNFQYLQSVSMECNRVLPERTFGDFLPKDNNEESQSGPLFQLSGRTRKTYKGLVMCVFYKDGWLPDSEMPQWLMRAFLEPVYVSSLKDKQDKCTHLVIQAVPALEKFRPRLFGSVREICAALSSHSLPKLKKKFQRSEDGLPITQFTEVLFKQLYETHPRIIEDAEAAYTVALLQEMFQQIDYNGDGGTNWDEFTTFCVQTGLSSNSHNRSSGNDSNYSLEQYVIEYGEEVLHRDHVLSAYRMVAQMRHVPETRKLLIIPEDSDNILILDEKFRQYTQLYPSKVQVVGSLNKKNEGGEGKEKKANASGKEGKYPRAMVYDVVFLTGREMYAYTASDHSITVCRELSSVNGTKVNFLQHNRFFHNLLHLKLCWSQKHDILCSTASDRVIYGWNIDTATIIFQVSRHSDIITDFIAVDSLDIFITCSMDKRIVLWSAMSRRVKGVLLGHKRGVRSLSVYENTLLSAGFECEAKTWDLANKDCVAILKGHRHPIVAAKLMCDRAQSEKEHRAITVDESGEFRLWNIFVRERASEPVPVPTIQIFEMQNGEHPLNQFRFLALPYNSRCSTSYYSNLIACSTKLLHFIPEKNTKEFVPPTAMVCHEAAATLVTAVGKSILMYDLALGSFDQIFENVTMHDIFSVCMDGERGRRMYLGTSSGEVILINSINGQTIDKVNYHTKEVTCLIQKKALRVSLFSCSMDGHVRVYEESGGKIHLQNSVDNVFGEGVGLSRIKVAPSMHAVVISSAGKIWGILNDTSFKKLLIIHEQEVITAIEVVSTSRDGDDSSAARYSVANAVKETLLTLAVALVKSINIYVLDTQDLRGIRSYELSYYESPTVASISPPIYITDLLVMAWEDFQSVNYSSMRGGTSLPAGGQFLLATTDDGKICIWGVADAVKKGEERFRSFYAEKEASAKTTKRKRHSSQASERRKSASGNTQAGSAAVVNAASSSGGNGSASFLTSVDLPSVNPQLSEEEKAALVAAGLFQKTKRPLGGAKNSRQSFLNNAATSWLESASKEIFPLALPKGVPPLEPAATHTSANVTPFQSGRGSILSPTRNSFLGKKPPRYSSALSSHTHILPPDLTWSSHADTVPAVVPLRSHGCFVTTSHDGFQRIWNLENECLGELSLPNLSETMKSNSFFGGGEGALGGRWRFILERLPVNKAHKELASVLVKNITQTKWGDGAAADGSRAALERRHFNFSSNFNIKSLRDNNSSDEEGGIGEKGMGDSMVGGEAQAAVRKTMLQSLREPPKFSEEPPPSRLPTKEEKELIKLAFAGGSPGGPLGGGGSLTASMSALTPGPSTVLGGLGKTLSLSTSSSPLRRNPQRSSAASLPENSLRSSLLFNSGG